MTTQIKNKIIFPPVSAEKETKIRGLIRVISEFMGADLEPQLQTIITVDIPKDRQDVFQVLFKIVQAVKNENSTPDAKKPIKEAK